MIKKTYNLKNQERLVEIVTTTYNDSIYALLFNENNQEIKIGNIKNNNIRYISENEKDYEKIIMELFKSLKNVIKGSKND